MHGAFGFRLSRGLVALVFASLAALLGAGFAAPDSVGSGKGAERAAKPASFVGKTSQGEPVSIKASRRGLRFKLAWSGSCDDGGEPFAGTTFNTKPLRLDKRHGQGRFKVAASFSDAAADGVEVAYTVELRGRVKKKRASGSWRIAASGPDTLSGRWSCDTKVVTWSARARRKGGTRPSAAAPGRSERGGGNSLGLQTTTRSPGKRAPGGGAAPAPGAPAPGTPAPGQGNDPAGSPGISSLTGQVLYTARDCFRNSAGQTPAGYEAPLDTAHLRLVPGSGSPVPATLDQDGRFTANIDPSQTYNAFAVLDSPLVSVGPDTSPSLPYEIPLGTVTQSNQRFLIGGGTGDTTPDPAEGAANIFAVLQEGARVGAKALPVVLPSIHARWRYASDLTGWLGDRNGSQYDSSSNAILVGGRQGGGGRDEYERLALLHEYGHHVLQTGAPPPDSASGPHGFGSVHRDNPGLPWSEGFAHAFAAIVTQSPQQMQGCRTVLDLGAEPATAEKLGEIGVLEPMPPAPNSHLAQYNETAVAGGLWHIVEWLGGGEAGLKQLLAALHAFHQTYGGPESLREARDALSLARLDATQADFGALDAALSSQRIGWGVGAGIGLTDFRPEGIFADHEVTFLLDGPYGKCQLSSDFVAAGYALGAKGGLPGVTGPFSDDCMLFGSDGQAPLSGFGAAGLALRFPYLDKQAHLDRRFTLSATWVCRDHPPPPQADHPEYYRCTADRGFQFQLTSHGFRYDQQPAPPASVRLRNGVPTELLRFDAPGGECEIVPTGEDCGI